SSDYIIQGITPLLPAADGRPPVPVTVITEDRITNTVFRDLRPPGLRDMDRGGDPFRDHLSLSPLDP
ncbi:unnamed protein product, partial [marine sediment metagenome]